MASRRTVGSPTPGRIVSSGSGRAGLHRTVAATMDAMFLRPPLHRLPRRPFAIVAVAASFAVAAAACGDGGGTDSAGRDVDGIAHVHGLGVDPEDGLVHIATHDGLYRLTSEGSVERVGDERSDYMGFTVIGPDHFVASGHPALGSDAFRELEQPLFGLIETTDGGVTWDARSLSGEVDFHALDAAHDRLYGYDATNSRLLVSDDGGTAWEVRSELSVFDLAVDPDDGDRIVASTGDGVIESGDGGRTWRPWAGAPAVVVLDWHADLGLWGLDGRGGLHHVAAGAWQVGEQLGGAPQALLVGDAGFVAAVGDGATAIHRSSDGREWELVHRSSHS